jgi:hypothetical protein
MLNKRQFTERFGDPRNFLFKGQVFDSRSADGSKSDARCDISGTLISRTSDGFIYILKQVQDVNLISSPEVAKFHIGSCCFGYFRKWNSDLYHKLWVAREFESGRQEAIARDKRQFDVHFMLKERQKQWRSLRGQALKRLVELRRREVTVASTALFGLLEETKQKPSSYKRPKAALRWFETHIARLQQQLRSI